MGTYFNIEANDGVWFPFFTSAIDPVTGDTKYDDPLPDAAEFRIRTTKKFYDDRILKRKRESQMVINPKTRQMEKVTSFKEQTVEEILEERADAIDYAITGIKNAFWDKERKVPVQCNKADKNKLNDISVFSRFLTRVWQIIEEQEVANLKVQEKNLLNSPSGGPA